MIPHVLFVDDEPHVLSGLRRMLRPQRSKWRMNFASTGKEALDVVESDPVDVIVSDMRMPGMDGSELLQRIADEHPSTVRLVLSGQSDHERVMRVIGPAHQFLSKPCESDVLINTIERVRSLCDQLGNESLRGVVARMECMPSLPGLYRALVSELQSDGVSLDRVAALIAEDMAMSAKVLQLVNSSFFGIPVPVACPKQAVAMLGLSLLRPLALMAGVFVEYGGKASAYSLEDAVDHGLAVATLARRIAAEVGLPTREIDAAYIAGMMHDVGKTVLAINLPDVYQAILQDTQSESIPFWEAESQQLGTTHAEIGAHLLTLWGMPHGIVEAVAYHHSPSSAPHPQTRKLDALAMVHMADGLVRAKASLKDHTEWADGSAFFDQEYLRETDRERKLARYWDPAESEELNHEP
ncbi:MAG: response regulator [Planctomycetota bacterium]